jgi:hypothetical protein
MRRLTISAICMSLVLSGVEVNRAAAAPRPNMANAKYVVPETSRFMGMYFVVDGTHYYKADPERKERPLVVERGSSKFIDDLVDRLEYEARTLCLDMTDNYSHNTTFNQAYENAYSLWQLTKEIQDHRQNSNRALMSAKVRELDSLFQPVRREVVGVGWSRHQKQRHGSGGVYDKIERTESLIHHLINDIGPTSRAPKLVKGGTYREPTPVMQR